MVMKQLNFNTLDELLASDKWHDISSQLQNSIKTMQTPVPQFGIQPHVVLPIFQKKEEQQYVLAINGEQRGPFTFVQVKELLKNGVITDDFYIWTSGMSEWKLIKECPQIMSEM